MNFDLGATEPEGEESHIEESNVHSIQVEDASLEFTVGNAPQELTKEMIQSSLSDLGHSATSGVVYTTVSVSHLRLNNIDAIVAFSHLQRIHLANNFLEDVAPLGSLEHIVSLDLSHNQITDDCFLHLAMSGESLQKLDLSYNRLTSIEGINKLPFLQEFSADFNEIVAMPTLVDNFSLHKLSLSNNKIPKIDGEFGDVPLRELYLQSNQICELTALECFAATLDTLNVADNNVMHAHVLEKLKKLSAVDMSSNNLYDLDETRLLASLPVLRSLSLIGNPLCSPNGLGAQFKPDTSDTRSDIVCADAGAEEEGVDPVVEARETSLKWTMMPPDEEDTNQFDGIDEASQYRLRIIWRVPQITTLDGVEVSTEEKADALNLEGGADREERQKIRASFFPSRDMEVPAASRTLSSTKGASSKPAASPHFVDAFESAPTAAAASAGSGFHGVMQLKINKLQR